MQSRCSTKQHGSKQAPQISMFSGPASMNPSLPCNAIFTNIFTIRPYVKRPWITQASYHNSEKLCSLIGLLEARHQSTEVHIVIIHIIDTESCSTEAVILIIMECGTSLVSVVGVRLPTRRPQRPLRRTVVMYSVSASREVQSSPRATRSVSTRAVTFPRATW